MVRVLVVEDDAELAETVAVGLRRRQLAVDVALDGRSGLDRALFTNYDVIVLDRDLPSLHGDEVWTATGECGFIAARAINKRSQQVGRGERDRAAHHGRAHHRGQRRQ